MNKKWDIDSIVQAIQEFHIINDRAPKVEDFKYNNNYPSYNTVVNHFGSWKKGIEAAKLEIKKLEIKTTKKSNRWDQKSIIDSIKKFYLLNNKAPKASDFNISIYPHNNTVLRYFKTWNKAIEASGLKANNYGEWDKNSIIAAIKQFHTTNNRIPQYIDFQHNMNYPSASTVQMYFGSWNEAISKAGFIPSKNIGFGNCTYGNDGILYRSGLEAYFSNNYLHGIYEYEYEKPYGNGWLYDFYVKELDLYIEIDGGFTNQKYKSRIRSKMEFNKINNINCKFITRNQIYNKELTLQC